MSGVADRDVVYLVKTGQGASTIAQWYVGGTYWTKFLQRTSAAKTQLQQPQWIVWYSLGLNDIAAGTPVATWKTAVLEHLGRIQTALPGCVIVMTEFQSIPIDNPSYDTAIQEIAASSPTIVSINTAGAGTVNGNHWSYSGFKNTVVPRMIAATLGLI